MRWILLALVLNRWINRPAAVENRRFRSLIFLSLDTQHAAHYGTDEELEGCIDRFHVGATDLGYPRSAAQARAIKDSWGYPDQPQGETDG